MAVQKGGHTNKRRKEARTIRFFPFRLPTSTPVFEGEPPLAERVFKRTFFAVLFLVLAAFAGLLLIAGFVPLPEPEVPVATSVFDQKGNLVTKLFVENRVEIPLSQVPQDLQDAVIAIEDSRFYQHHGIDPRSLLRALWRNLLARRVVEGGSTITQQLAKNLYLTQQRTISRKIEEFFLTLKLEMKYSKKEILGMYLNLIYLGHGAYGVEVASQTYFGKPARELNLSESALLAGLIRGPEYYSPYIHPDLARARRNEVLDRMAEVGYLTPAQAERARKTPIKLVGLKPPSREAPYFISYVVQQLVERHPGLEKDLYRAGYRIFTTLNLKRQRDAERSFAEGFPKTEMDANGVEQPQGALVAINPNNGYIEAMIGGRNFSHSQLNRAIPPVRRQPGSAFKPFLYSAVITAGFPPTNQQTCEPVSFPSGGPEPYAPHDYGEKRFHYRPMMMREALAISDNVVAVRWASAVGPAKIIEFARRMGIESALEPSLPLALGTSEVAPLEMATGYAPLANGGSRVEPLAVLKVTDRFGNVLEENSPTLLPALDPPVAYIVTDLLRGVLQPGGTGGHLAAYLGGRPVAGKTGTTDDLRDAWFVGYTPSLVTAVYVGYDDPKRSLWSTGGVVAGPIWASFMSGALAGVPPEDFPLPAGVTRADICSETGLIPNPTCPVRSEVFLDGTEPKDICPVIHGLPKPGAPELPGLPGPQEKPSGPGQPGQPPAEAPPPGPPGKPDLPGWLDKILRGGRGRP